MDRMEDRLNIPQWFELGVDQVEFWTPLVTQLVPAPPLLNELSGPGLTLDEFDARAMAEKVSHDAVLSARILAVANSARFGLAKPMTGIQRAMVHLGFNMVKSIIMTYLLESRFAKPLPVPTALMQHIQRWTAGSAVLAYRWGQAAELRDPATAGTLALLSRIGSLLIGLAVNESAGEYLALPDEVQRLEYEFKTWRLATPTLGAELARCWDVPAPIPRLIERLWEPVVKLVSPDPLDPDPPVLTLVAASLCLVESHLRKSGMPPNEVLDSECYRYLKHNLIQHHLADSLPGVWSSARTMRELAAVIE